MGIADCAIVEELALAVKPEQVALIASEARLAEEALLTMARDGESTARSANTPMGVSTADTGMAVRMFRVLRNDGRGPFSNFNWETGGHLPRLTEEGWIPGKAISHEHIPSETDPDIKPLLKKRAGMGDGIYLTTNPFKWVDRPNDRVFEAFLRDQDDQQRLRDFVAQTSPERISEDYFLNDFNALGKVALTRELDQVELNALRPVARKPSNT